MAQQRIYNHTIDTENTLYIIDGSSFLYRAYYGLKPLHTPQGVQVQAVYSFCRMIKKLIDTFDPHFCALVWDSRGITVRHQIYPEYKATRMAPPSDLSIQKELIMRFAHTIGIKQVAQENTEADDLMYSLAKELANNAFKAILVTSDKDLGQALDENTLIFDPFKDKIIDIEDFKKDMGFPVNKLCFYHSLVGDSSDNIPGVKGIGKKGAAELIMQFETLKDLYEKIDQVKSERTKNALITNKENAFLSEELFKLRFIPTGLKQQDVAFDAHHWIKARPFFSELNFSSLIKTTETASSANQSQMSFLSTTPQASATTRISLDQKYDFRCIRTEKQLDELCTTILQAKAFALDTETDGLNSFACNCIGISICTEESIAYYIPFGHMTEETQLDRRLVLEKLKPILEDSSIKKYLHNAKFDCLVIRQYGIRIQGIAFDSLISSRLLLREWQKVGLKALSEYYFEEQMLSFQDVTSNTKVKNFASVNLAIATAYSAADAHQTFKLAQRVKEELAKEEQIAQLYFEIEHPLIQVLIDMEAEGIELDKEFLSHVGSTVQGSLEAVELAIRDMVNMPDINLNSPAQISDLLFNRLGLPVQKKSSKGTNFSTDQEVLSTLSSLHPVPGLISQYRELSKLKSTYIDALPTYINKRTGKIHTSFSQVMTATGRLASSDPNLQNIPTDGHSYGKTIRGAFKPKQGHVFISADYDQIELRVLAYLSQDLKLKEAFAYNHDIHRQTAASIFQISPDAVTHEQREIGKKINFSILYGQTPYGLSKDLKISHKEAKHYIDAYFAQYPGVSIWAETVINEVTAHGYVQTLYGRRRYIPTIFEKNHVLRQEANRLAVNTKVQGTAADIMKIGMINIAHEIEHKQIDAALVLQIHDEIIVTAHHEIAHEIEKLITEKLESVVTWNIPLSVTTRQGHSWKDVTK